MPPCPHPAGTRQAMLDSSSQGMHRAIRLHHATAMVAGTIIGASIFVQPSEITGHVPTVGGTAAVWLVAGALTLLGALVTAELASRYQESGGVYVYLREAYGPWLGFLWGWAMFWVMHSGIIAAIAVVFARYVGFLVPLGPAGTSLVAVAAILVLSGVNYVGVRQGSNLQTAFTVVKVVAIVLMVAVGFAVGPAEASDVAAAGAAAGPGPDSAPGGFAVALVAALFAFGGWHMVTYNAEETVDARTTIPRALALGVLLVTACYVLLNAVYFHVLPLETVIRSDRVAADAADAVMGRGGGVVMAALVVFSTFGALSGIVLAGPRVYFAMARDGLLFRWVGALHPRFRTPHRAIVLQAVWASVLAATGTYRALFTRVVHTEWIFFGLMAIGLVLLRGRPGPGPGYRVPGYPLTPLVFAAGAFALVGSQLAESPARSATGLAFLLLGLPIYLVWVRPRGSRTASSGEP